MVARCTEHLLEGGKLWDQDPAALIAKLRGCIALHEAYQGAYRDASPKRGGLHFVFDVDLRTEDPPARWILRGVCLLTTKD